MDKNQYSAPSANLEVSSAQFSELLNPLLDTKLWVRICSIMGFIVTGLMVLMGVFMMVGMSAFSSMASAGMGGLGAGFGIGLGLFYILFSLLSFFPSLFLHKYANAINSAQRSRSAADIALALRYQKSFWKFVGIVALIYLAFMGLFLVIGILAGAVGFMAS